MFSEQYRNDSADPIFVELYVGMVPCAGDFGERIVSPRHGWSASHEHKVHKSNGNALTRFRPGMATDFVGHESLSLNDTGTAETYPIRRMTPIQSDPVSHSEDGRVS
jgi:hypothetical protein